MRTVDSADLIATSATHHCLLDGNVWGDGNILLGGAGSDLLEGRGADDIIDGDRYLNVRLSVRTNPADPDTEIGTTDLMGNVRQDRGNFGTGTTGMTLQQAVFAGLVDPGNIVAVRELLEPANGTAVDTAVFGGAFLDYTVTRNVDGSVTVAHTAPVGGGGGGVAVDDGTDTLWNMERAQFVDRTVDLTGNQPAEGTVTISDTTPAEDQQLTVTDTITDPDGVGTLTYNWQAETAPNTFVTVASGSTFTPVDAQVGHRLRVAAHLHRQRRPPGAGALGSDSGGDQPQRRPRRGADVEPTTSAGGRADHGLVRRRQRRRRPGRSHLPIPVAVTPGHRRVHQHHRCDHPDLQADLG